MAEHGDGVLYVLYHGDTCLGVGTPEQFEREFGIKKTGACFREAYKRFLISECLLAICLIW